MTAPVAVVANPTKISADLREAVTAALARAGRPEPLWLETSEDDPGHAMARKALEQGSELILAAGGDGTVRVVAGELAETGVTMGLLPSGTGNLLARNLDIPLDDAGAIELALSEQRRTIDLIKVVADDQDPAWSAVMTGIGVDAMIMEGTDSTLKKKVGSAAYFVAAAQQLGRLPVKITVTVDDERPFHRRSVLCALGNVSQLTGGLELLPGADPADGKLTCLIASPRRVTDWVNLVGRILLRHRRPDHALDQFDARKVVVEIRDGDAWQMDGDSAGECRRLTAEIVPGALTLAAPPA